MLGFKNFLLDEDGAGVVEMKCATFLSDDFYFIFFHKLSNHDALKAIA